MPIYIPNPETFKVAAFLKFGKKCHMEALRDKGHIYMNRLDYFRKLERKDKYRGDRDEGITDILQPKDVISLSFTNDQTGESSQISPDNIIGPLKMNHGGPHHHIYCLYTIPACGGYIYGPIVNDYCTNFPDADTFALIRHPRFFTDRLKIELCKLPIQPWEQGKIDYVDFTTYSGEVGCFKKDIRYSHQKEFRIAIPSPTLEPLTVKLGDLNDIIYVGALSEIQSILSIRVDLSTHIVPISSTPDFSNQRYVSVIGNFSILDDDKITAYFCSNKCPDDLISRSSDLAQAWNEANEVIIGGFNTLVEKGVLDILIKGEQPLLICPARGIGRMRLRKEWKAEIVAKRLLIFSLFNDKLNRATVASTQERNRFVTTLADRLFVSYAHAGSKTEALVRRAIEKGKPVCTFNHPATANLREMGALALDVPDLLPEN